MKNLIVIIITGITIIVVVENCVFFFAQKKWCLLLYIYLIWMLGVTNMNAVTFKNEKKKRTLGLSY